MNKLKTILHGFIIGAGMSIPGFSGGTIAILLGIYDKLLHSVSDLLKDLRENGAFLLLTALGGAGGLALSALVITRLLATPAETPLRFAFLGAAAGCLPPMLREAKLTPLKSKNILLMVGGAAAAMLVSLLPSGLLASSDGVAGAALQMLGGILVAAALVLPGISASQMMYILGIYEPVLACVAEGDILQLLPLICGVLAGILGTAKLLSILLERFNGTYAVIIGFMLYSLKEMVPQFSSQTELVIGFICAAIGFVMVSLCSKKENKNHDVVQKSY